MTRQLHVPFTAELIFEPGSKLKSYRERPLYWMLCTDRETYVTHPYQVDLLWEHLKCFQNGITDKQAADFAHALFNQQDGQASTIVCGCGTEKWQVPILVQHVVFEGEQRSKFQLSVMDLLLVQGHIADIPVALAALSEALNIV
jgi:hypothetical protein